MKFLADDYFHIGQMHLVQGKPCQDYAFSSIYNSTGFAIVSDGCSSGRHTDIGSRIITLSAAASIKENECILGVVDRHNIRDTVRLQQENMIAFARESLNLGLEDMLATSGYVCLGNTGGFVHLRGDGAVAIVAKGGGLRLILCQWEKNTPLYPAYYDDKYQAFIRHHGGDPQNLAMRVEQWMNPYGATFYLEDQESYSIAKGIEGFVLEFTEEDLTKISCVAVFTDGVTQVGSIQGGGGGFLDWKEVVTQLVAFKSFTGEFAKRRIMRFLKDKQKIGKNPLDDIAYAVVKIESDEGC